MVLVKLGKPQLVNKKYFRPTNSLSLSEAVVGFCDCNDEAQVLKLTVTAMVSSRFFGLLKDSLCTIHL